MANKQTLLDSAKDNLRNMAFFGLKSYPNEKYIV